MLASGRMCSSTVTRDLPSSRQSTAEWSCHRSCTELRSTWITGPIRIINHPRHTQQACRWRSGDQTSAAVKICIAAQLWFQGRSDARISSVAGPAQANSILRWVSACGKKPKGAPDSRGPSGKPADDTELHSGARSMSCLRCRLRNAAAPTRRSARPIGRDRGAPRRVAPRIGYSGTRWICCCRFPGSPCDGHRRRLRTAEYRGQVLPT